VIIAAALLWFLPNLAILAWLHGSEAHLAQLSPADYGNGYLHFYWIVHWDHVARLDGILTGLQQTNAALPPLLAAGTAAVLLGRELGGRNGATLWLWTQAASPTRWLLSKLGTAAALTLIGTGTLAVLAHAFTSWLADHRLLLDTADNAALYRGIGPLGSDLLGAACCLLALAIGALTATAVQRRSRAGAAVAAWLGAMLVGAALKLVNDRLNDAHAAGLRLLTVRYAFNGHPASKTLITGASAATRWAVPLIETGVVLALTALAALAAVRLLRRRTA
jgi:hypothetical protein